MARVTVEDCLARIPNHFDLCQIAAKRARQLARGAEAHLPWGDHKSTVLTLKEIAGGYVDISVMSEADLPAIHVSKMDLDLPELAPDI
jgi:DNA-directed RNA polymerase subunit omega